MIKRNLLSLAIAAPAMLCSVLPSTTFAHVSVSEMAADELASLENMGLSTIEEDEGPNLDNTDNNLQTVIAKYKLLSTFKTVHF